MKSIPILYFLLISICFIHCIQGNETQVKGETTINNDTYDLLNDGLFPFLDTVKFYKDSVVLLNSFDYPVLIFNTFIEQSLKHGIDTSGVFTFPQENGKTVVNIRYPQYVFMDHPTLDANRLNKFRILSKKNLIKIDSLYSNDKNEFNMSLKIGESQKVKHSFGFRK